ncbi:MAG: hypothetical protein JWO70_1266 [Betaproteobacteria bacterium]|nr:hypothetical protein [Betaproteobacteria bacterium]
MIMPTRIPDMNTTEATPHVVGADESVDAVNDYFYERGWTDGLPIIPPNEERVEAMLAGMPWRGADELINIVPPRMGRATLRQIAVNAVMAGCKPEYLPVVVAALQAVSEPAYGLSHRQTTTHAGAPLIIVNGPIVERLRINCGRGLFGPGWRANATIGRALRLVLVNVGGAGPGVDASQTGHPGKYTYCIAEYEAANPWEPLHVERGFAREQSVVTLVNTEAPHSMTENIQTVPEEIVRTFASCMATLGVNNLYSQGNPVLVLGIEHAQHIASAGWTKLDLQKALFEQARQPWGLAKNRGKSKGPRFPEFVDRNDDTSMVPIVREPGDLVLIVAGGAGGKSMFLPTAGGQSLSVSRVIETGVTV